jgi:ubiquinone/menaquinone biosynthesis C-methylase UbiE
VSPEALSVGRAQIGDAGPLIDWILGDVMTANLPDQAFDLWHDRAVFHFLTSPEDRQRYLTQVQRTLRNGGYAVVATFADDGPLTCSGLNVARYSVEQLSQEFGNRFALAETRREEHVTPSGATQSFVYCLFRLDGRI